MKWLLFDFGEREASVRSSREELLVANLAFNATHQKLVFEVSKNFALTRRMKPTDLPTAREWAAESGLSVPCTNSKREKSLWLVARPFAYQTLPRWLLFCN